MFPFGANDRVKVHLVYGARGIAPRPPALVPVHRVLRLQEGREGDPGEDLDAENEGDLQEYELCPSDAFRKREGRDGKKLSDFDFQKHSRSLI